MTDRQIHYALLNGRPLIHAAKNKALCQHAELLQAADRFADPARLQGIVPWDALHDPTRPVEVWNFHRQPGTFVREQLDHFLKGYYRDLQQSQPNYIEIVGEKITIQNMIRPLAMEYCINYIHHRPGFGAAPQSRLRRRRGERRLCRDPAGTSRWTCSAFADLLAFHRPRGTSLHHPGVRTTRDTGCGRCSSEGRPDLAKSPQCDIVSGCHGCKGHLRLGLGQVQ